MWGVVLALLASLLGLVVCRCSQVPTQQAETISLTATPTAPEATTLLVPTVTSPVLSEVEGMPEASPTLEKSPIPRPTTPTWPTDIPPRAAGLKCIGAAAGGGHPPERTENLRILVAVPLKKHAEVVSYFSQIGRECDGLGFLGKFAEQVDWQDMVREVPRGILFYHLTSLEHARQTADQWADDVDWFVYEITFLERTPEEERNNPAQASRMALQFAREHGLVYMVLPGVSMSRQHRAELAQYADVYGVSAHRVRRESPERFIRLVKRTSRRVRAVNPDILVFVGFITRTPEDDPQVMYELTTELLGYIDGVYITAMSGPPDSIEKLKTLVNLLREE